MDPHQGLTRRQVLATAGATAAVLAPVITTAGHIDFGAAAARYVDAFFANVQWDEVQGRLESARKT